MLWAAERANLHLLASIHLSDQTRSALYPEAERVYRAAERVTFEHDMMQPLNISLMENQPGNLLSQQVPGGVFANATIEWTKLGLDPARLEKLRPWAVAISSVFRRAAKRGLQEAYGVDKPLWQRATQDAKALKILELPDDAIASLGSGPLSEQTMWLDYVTSSPDVADKELDDLIDAWHRHDDAALEILLANRLALLPVTFGNAVTRRNHLWMPALLKQVAEEIPTLIVVGAFHCIGDEGLPELLKRAGVYLSRVV
jgi:uncharacterized protein YbaP (TraB family)